jgi:hypothetical protein
MLSRIDQLPGVVDLLRRQFPLASELYTPALRILNPGAGPFAGEAALQFRKYSNHLPHGPACRCLGVD